MGRPKGHKSRPFEYTRLGFYLLHEAPVEYALLKEVMLYQRECNPPVELVESICYSSDAPLFRKQKFWKALMYYRKYKCNPEKVKLPGPKSELRYIRRELREYVNWQD